MFERYTERARRVIFFARFEASNFGSMTIETEHLLLGLIREDKNLMERFRGEKSSASSILEDVSRRVVAREKVPTSVDLPLSSECTRILAYAADEAERLKHNHIGTEHLLLGMLREEKSVAAEILRERGLELQTIRDELGRALLQVEPPAGPLSSVVFRYEDTPQLPPAGVVPDPETAKRIAKVIWTPLYGIETVESQAPLKAELQGNVWGVTGSSAPETLLFAFILKTDGRILSVGRGSAKL